MALFGKRENAPSGKRRGGTTIIARGTSVQGDLVLEGNLHIDGALFGTIQSQGDVSVGASGSFDGEVKAHRMVVSGLARGRIECESLEIVEKGKVLGEVASRTFVIEPGGQFVGESRSSDEEAVKALGHQSESEPDGRAATAEGENDADVVRLEPQFEDEDGKDSYSDAVSAGKSRR